MRLIFLLGLLASAAFGQGGTGVGVGVGEATTQEPVDLVWASLFELDYDDQVHGIFLRPDLKQVGGGYAVKLADMSATQELDVEIFTGASFVESNRFGVYSFNPQTEYFLSGTDPIAVTIRLDAVSGVLYDGDGESCIVMGYISVVHFIGYGGYSGDEIIGEIFFPLKMPSTLQQADDMAFDLADIPTEQTLIECDSYSDFCDEEFCYWGRDVNDTYNCELGKCGGGTLGLNILINYQVTGTYSIFNRLQRSITFESTMVGDNIRAFFEGIVVSQNAVAACRAAAKARYQARLLDIINAYMSCDLSDPPNFPATPWLVCIP